MGEKMLDRAGMNAFCADATHRLIQLKSGPVTRKILTNALSWHNLIVLKGIIDRTEKSGLSSIAGFGSDILKEYGIEAGPGAAGTQAGRNRILRRMMRKHFQAAFEDLPPLVACDKREAASRQRSAEKTFRILIRDIHAGAVVLPKGTVLEASSSGMFRPFDKNGPVVDVHPCHTRTARKRDKKKIHLVLAENGAELPDDPSLF